jgi:YD repeat-containing protein
MMNSKVIIATLNIPASSSAHPIICPLFRALRLALFLAALMLASTIVRAQADFEKGYQAFQSYHGSDFDTVNLANGNLVLNIPLLSYEQRGGVPPVTISIRSNSTTFQSSPAVVNGPTDTNQHEVAGGVIGAPWGQPHVSISPGGLSWKEERIVSVAKSAAGPEYLVRFVAIDDSGATHSLGGSIANSTAGYVPGIRYSVDGSGLMLQPGTQATGSVLVDRKGNTGGLIDPNGNSIALTGHCATPAGSGDLFNASLASWEGYAHGTASATSITDTIGRVIQNPSYLPPLANSSCLVDLDASYQPPTTTPDAGFGNGGVCHIFPAGSPLTYHNAIYSPEYYAETFQYPGEGGAQDVPLTFCYAQIPVSANIPQVNGANLTSETINEKWWALTSVTLPNGTYWQFGYDNYGQVETVIMPTGAMVTYAYATRLACGNPPGQIPVVGTPVWPYSNILSSRMVIQRNVYLNYNDIANNIAPIEIWKYNNAIGSGWAGGPPANTSNPNNVVTPAGPNSGKVTVTDPAGNVTVHVFSLIGGSTCGPYETSTQYYQGAATLLREVDTAYSNTGTDYANPTNFSNYIALGVFPSTVTTTLSTSTAPLISKETYQYDSFGSYQDATGITHRFSFGQMLSSAETDWGSTAPLRTTLHTKLWQTNWNYYAANLIDLPCLDTVLTGSYTGQTPTNPQPGCSATFANQIAQTSYAYDEPAPLSYTGSMGNQTSATRWLQGSTIGSTSVCSSNGSGPTTHNYYTAASFGMPVDKLDACGNKTQLIYDASGLYLQQLIYPDQTTEFPKYDDNTGLLLSNTDVNGQKTSYSYDPMRRLTGVKYPDNGSETLSYTDTIGNLSVTFAKAITSTTSLEKIAVADGLGRLTQTQLASDPYGTVYTDTTYDNLGRVVSVSNPYRNFNEGTYGITRYIYDALSRKAIVIAPDGTKKQACFNGINTVGQSNCHPNLLAKVGSWEDDADENGNDWQRTENALGQMTTVAEPDGVNSLPSMETDYTYDILNNLLSVKQWGGANGSSGARATRSFTYDSLSRLGTSTNPETGTSSYLYDLNGNVTSRTDARSIITSYQYDNMNRLLSKRYSGDVSGTPSSCYQYGTSSAGNTVGRLISAWTQSTSAGACAPTAPLAGFLSARTNISYDQMGRIKNEQQFTLANQATGTVYAPAYSYDLAGDLVSSTDGVTPTPAAGTTLAFTSAFDAAGRLQAMTSNWSDATHPGVLFTAQTGQSTPCLNSSSAPYSGFGGLMNAAYGYGLVLNRSYDNRLRTTCETDTGSVAGTSTSGSVTVSITGSEQSK